MTPVELVDAVLSGDPPEHALLDALLEPSWYDVVNRLLDEPAGRRWLRAAPQTDRRLHRPEFHLRMLNHEEDFRTKRRDATLANFLTMVGSDMLLQNMCAILSGSAARFFWDRWGDHPDEITRIAVQALTSCDADAAESTLYLLVVDPLDPYRLGDDRRHQIAASALRSPDADVRGLAAEYLTTDAPAELLADFDVLVQDDSERVRGIVWSAALRLARVDARDLAFTLIADEDASLEVRRSALIAVGTILPTVDLIDLLSFLVVHPSVELASDAASLLFHQHRQPDIALAAQRSPHAHIRDIAEQLLDPLRGSPAAGGTRTGANTADIYRDVIRQFEERAGDDRDDPAEETDDNT